MTTYTKMKKSFAIGILASMIALPAATFADNGKENKYKNGANLETSIKYKNDREDDDDEKQDKKNCLRAYGHLIAYGWLKNNATGTLEINGCELPKGIAKLLGLRNGTTTTPTTTPDTIAPVITNISVNAGVSDATIKWSTNERTSSVVYYGTSTPVNVNSSTTLSVSKNDKTFDHKIALKGLTASTTYYVVIKSTDKSGNSTTSAQTSFTTKATVADVVAPLIRMAYSFATGTSIYVIWNTSEPATSKVYYSTSTPVDINSGTTASVGTNELSRNHILQIPNLATSTQYYMTIESKDAAGNVSTSTGLNAKVGF